MNTWGEKNYIKPKSNCLNNNEQEPSDTTKITKSDSTQPQWKDIGGVKKWIRHCPECGDEITYTDKGNRNTAEKSKRLCKMCLAKSKRLYETPDKLERNCPDCNKVIQYIKGKDLSIRRHRWLRDTRENRSCNSCARKGINNGMAGTHRTGKDNPNYNKRWSVEKRVEYSKRFSGKNATWYGRKHTEKTKELKRNIALDNLKKLGKFGVGKNACDYLDKLSLEMGWTIQHAKNGGEFRLCGYLVDGYDSKLNIVVEYDEPFHYTPDGKLKQKDIDRMNKIIHHLRCRFYRYNEKTKEFYECKSNFNSTTIV